MQRILLAAFAVLCSLYGCKKSGGSPPPPPPPDTKYILTSFRYAGTSPDHDYLFEFNANGRPSALRHKVLGALQPDSTLFFYNDKGQLIRSVDYNDVMGTTPREIYKYFYNTAGQLTSDSSYDANGYGCWHCFTTYEYDNKGRLSKYTDGSSFFRRFEYGNGNNPVKSFMKPWDEDVEALEYEFLEFDDKKPFFGVDSAMRIILRTRSFGNDVEYPMPAMANNVVKMKWHPYPYVGTGSGIRDFKIQLEYNADGYPTKSVMKYKEVGYDDTVTRTQHFTFQKIN